MTVCDFQDQVIRVPDPVSLITCLGWSSSPMERPTRKWDLLWTSLSKSMFSGTCWELGIGPCGNIYTMKMENATHQECFFLRASAKHLPVYRCVHLMSILQILCKSFWILELTFIPNLSSKRVWKIVIGFPASLVRWTMNSFWVNQSRESSLNREV